MEIQQLGEFATSRTSYTSHMSLGEPPKCIRSASGKWGDALSDGGKKPLGRLTTRFTGTLGHICGARRPRSTTASSHGSMSQRSTGRSSPDQHWPGLGSWCSFLRRKVISSGHPIAAMPIIEGRSVNARRNRVVGDLASFALDLVGGPELLEFKTN